MSQLYVARVTSVCNSHFYQACKCVLRDTLVWELHHPPPSPAPHPHLHRPQHHWSMHMWGCFNQPPSECLRIKYVFFSRALTAFVILANFRLSFLLFISLEGQIFILHPSPPPPPQPPQELKKKKTLLKGFKAWHNGSCFVNKASVISWGRRREGEKGVCQ